MRRLEAHPWPGNVWELETVLEEAMIMKGRGWLAPADLDVDPARAESRPGAAQPAESLRPITRCLQAALEIAAVRGTVTRGHLAIECGFSGELARRALVDLARLGHLRRQGRGRSTRYVIP